MFEGKRSIQDDTSIFKGGKKKDHLELTIEQVGLNLNQPAFISSMRLVRMPILNTKIDLTPSDFNFKP